MAIEDVREVAPITNPEPELSAFLWVVDAGVVIDTDFPDKRASFLSDPAVITNTVVTFRTANLVLRSTAKALSKTSSVVRAVFDVRDTAIVLGRAVLPNPYQQVGDSFVANSYAYGARTARLTTARRSQVSQRR